MNIFHMALVTLEQTCLHFPLVLGAYVSISLMKLPDLSIEAAYLFGALLATRFMMMQPGLPLGVTFVAVILASIVGGVIVGAVASMLTRYAKIPHLLSSILTVGLFHGVNQLVLGTSMVSLSSYANVLTVDWLPTSPELPAVLAVMLVLAVVGYFVFKTQLGYAWAVFGNNPRFFDHYRIASNFVVLTGVMVANGLAGISGFFVAQSSGFVDVNAGHGMALFCITALILGKTFACTKQFFSIRVPVMGTLMYFIIMQMLLKIGFNQKYFTMMQALFVIVILMYKHRHHGRQAMVDHLGV